uniref:Uncharacterized protein n=1 Tax=Haptolina ericina TaxID=156174 RepID=A0A7S3F482_9EUKA|mmetsp:Transcript_47187/g.106363  ORF Transcript_47187/g.106363 Transcript_47187/m.106363 type:complete len:255 (+) Transcript_47187:246-1010(+)
MQLLTFHIGLMSREMTTYEFIMAQRQRQKEFDQVHGKASLSRKQRQQRWVENNAPCLAVCVVCDDSPAKGASSAKAQAAAVKVTIGSEQRGRAFPRFLSWGSSSPQNVANGMAQPSAPMDERAPCASESDLPHTRVVAAQALPEPQGVVEEAPGQNENQDSNAHAELSSVHIAAASAVQEGYLEATAMQIAGPGCSSVSLASAGTDSEGADIPRGRKLVLAPIGTAPTVSSSVHEPNAVPPIGEGAGQETSLPR